MIEAQQVSFDIARPVLQLYVILDILFGRFAYADSSSSLL